MIFIKNKRFLILGVTFGLVALTSTRSLAMQDMRPKKSRAFTDGGVSPFRCFRSSYFPCSKNFTWYHGPLFYDSKKYVPKKRRLYAKLPTIQWLSQDIVSLMQLRNCLYRLTDNVNQLLYVNQLLQQVVAVNNQESFSVRHNRLSIQPQTVLQQNFNQPFIVNDVRRSGRKRERDERESGVSFKDDYAPAEKKRRIE